MNQIIYRRTAVLLSLSVALSGCELAQAPILNPKGPIALAERNLLFAALALMLLVVIPVFLMTLLFTLRYRASNGRARYAPDWSYSAVVDAVIWLIPAAIVGGLSVMLWNATHKLDPYRQLSATNTPLGVQAVAQDWKWMFIYPEENIATVNELVFPSNTSLNLKITSDTVMNSFFIPALGGQVYAMAGMQTRLSLLADAPGRFLGRNTQYSGDGFANQHFAAVAVTPPEFEAWVARVRQSPSKLTGPAYEALARPSIAHAVTYYSEVEPGLFATIIAKYSTPQPHGAHAASRPRP